MYQTGELTNQKTDVPLTMTKNRDLEDLVINSLMTFYAVVLVYQYFPSGCLCPLYALTHNAITHLHIKIQQQEPQQSHNSHNRATQAT